MRSARGGSMETSWRFHGKRRCANRNRQEPLGSCVSVRVHASAARAVLGLHLGAVTHGALAVGLAGLLDVQVHGGAGSRLKGSGEQVAKRERSNVGPLAVSLLHFLAWLCLRGGSEEQRYRPIISQYRRNIGQ